MILHRLAQAALAGTLMASLAACGGGPSSAGFGSGPFSGGGALRPPENPGPTVKGREAYFQKGTRTSLRDLMGNRDNPNTTLEVNKYLWTASLDVLNFLPIESVDPFTGVIVFGYGTPPGGGRAYRATVYVQDPALDARSLKLAMQTRGGGAVDPATIRAVEDAILTRARQLRVRDGKL